MTVDIRKCFVTVVMIIVMFVIFSLVLVPSDKASAQQTSIDYVPNFPWLKNCKWECNWRKAEDGKHLIKIGMLTLDEPLKASDISFKNQEMKTIRGIDISGNYTYGIAYYVDGLVRVEMICDIKHKTVTAQTPLTVVVSLTEKTRVIGLTCPKIKIGE